MNFAVVETVFACAIVSALIQMGAQPWLASLQAGWYHMGAEQRQVLVLITAMPSAVLGPVLAVQYTCAGATASTLTVTHILPGALIIPLAVGMFV